MIDELYVENGVGKDVLKVINLFTKRHGVTAIWQHEVHPQMQRKQKGDEWWIADIAKRGMAILTQDRAILQHGAERQAIIDSQATVIAFGNAHYSTWDKLRCVLNHWDAIDALLRGTGPQAVTLLLTDVRHEEF